MCMMKKAAMGKEDETPKLYQTSGGVAAKRNVGRPCKNPKPKPIKVPQRGLGVAELERIRLEEEQKEAAAAAAAIAAASFQSTYDDMNHQYLNSNHPNQQPPNSLPSSTLVSFANSSGGGGVGTGAGVGVGVGVNRGMSTGASMGAGAGSNSSLHAVPVIMGQHASGGQMWGSHDIQFGTNPPPGFPSISHLPNWMQKTQQRHPSSSMVSFYSSGTSSATVPPQPPHSSTVPPHSSMELTLSQNHGSGSHVSKRHEEKMIGVKRQNPFSMTTFPATVKASETISPGSGRGFNLDFGNSTLREIPSLSASKSKPKSKKTKKENKNSGGDVLTLAPPTPLSSSKSKFKPSSALPPLCHQGKMKEQIPPPIGPNQFNQQQQHLFISIPPSANVAQIGQQSDRFQNSNVVGESIELDLNLKL